MLHFPGTDNGQRLFISTMHQCSFVCITPNTKVSTENMDGVDFEEPGTIFGYVLTGEVTFYDKDKSVHYTADTWFSMPTFGKTRMEFESNTSAFAVNRIGWGGLRVQGYGLEHQGRLSYIDGCSDTMLLYPPRMGDPSMSHLHFPERIRQTEHTHPSIRVGMVVRGRGVAEYVVGGRSYTQTLEVGDTFILPAHCKHRFITDDDTMDVLAWHPDGDWGPTDEFHQMRSRTYIGNAR